MKLDKIIHECLTHILNEGRKPNVYWNDYEHCKAEAKKYRNRSEFARNAPGAYKQSRQNSWIDEFFPKKKRKRLNRI